MAQGELFRINNNFFVATTFKTRRAAWLSTDQISVSSIKLFRLSEYHRVSKGPKDGDLGMLDFFWQVLDWLTVGRGVEAKNENSANEEIKEYEGWSVHFSAVVLVPPLSRTTFFQLSSIYR